MQLQQLIYFDKIAELGSINKAAEALLVTQPNLSKAIRNLEDELHIQLFKRNNKGVSMTENGQKLYQYTRTILNQLDLINGIASQEAVQLLSIVSYPVISISRLISRFYEKHMNEEIRIQLLEERLQRVIEMVATGEAEVGFLMYNNVQSKEVRHMLHYKNMEVKLIGIDTWHINVGPKSPFYDRTEISIRELLDYPIVRRPDDYFSNLTFYLCIDGVPLTEFKKVVYMGDSAAVINMLKYTDVFRFTPGISRQDFEEYGIRTIPIKNCDVKIGIAWIHRKKEVLSKAAEEFTTMLEAWISEVLS